MKFIIKKFYFKILNSNKVTEVSENYKIKLYKLNYHGLPEKWKEFSENLEYKFNSFSDLYFIFSSSKGSRGDNIPLWASLSQSKHLSLKKGCYLTCDHPFAPNLWLGYSFSNPWTRSFRLLLTLLFYHILSVWNFLIALINYLLLLVVCVLKGVLKFDIS